MRFKEIISEEVVKADIDWQQWKAAMAASAIERNVPKGIDAIVYLGIIGDPVNSDLGVRFKRTAQVGMDVSAKGQGYIQPGASAQYSANDFTMYGPKDSSRDQVGRDFDILFDFQGEPLERQNWKKFQDALSNTLAHELMHRGLAIIDRVPSIKATIPEPSKTYFEQRFSTNIKGLYNVDELDPRRDFFPTSTSPGNAYLEHMMIYAMFATQEYLNRSNNVEFTAQVQKFRKIYMDIESAANRYVLSYPIPPGSLPALRAELDNKTPDNINVTVKMDNKVPTVELTKSQDTASVANKRMMPPSVPVAWIDPDKTSTSKITAPTVSTSEPVVAKTADPVVAKTAVPVVAKTAEPVAVQPPKSAVPVVAKTAEPVAVQPPKSADSASDAGNTAVSQGISNGVIKGQKVSTSTSATPTGYKGSTGAQKLQQLNPGIKDVNIIYPGQKIKLPNNTTVTVKQGDTLDKIASQNNIKEDQLIRIKHLAGLKTTGQI